MILLTDQKILICVMLVCGTVAHQHHTKQSIPKTGWAWMTRPKILLIGAVVLAYMVVALALYARTLPRSGGIYFDDQSASVMKLGSGSYEIGLSKENGAILYVLNQASGQRVSEGNSVGKLWEVGLLGSAVRIGSDDYSAGGAASFTYAWQPAENRLVLTYTPDPAERRKLAVQVSMTASRGSVLDMDLTLDNQSGYSTESVQFPSNLMFGRSDVDEALLPILPGIVLERGFFEQIGTYEITYPGYPGVFADFMALTSDKGSLALYAGAPDQPLIPVLLGFQSTRCAESERVCYTHNFRVRAANQTTWKAPRVRLQVSDSWENAIEGYRALSGIGDSPSLEQKLGESYSKVAQSPLYKVDVTQMGMKFKEYPLYLGAVPTPGILHLVAYSPGGHDRNYPDFVPPDPYYGTTEDLAKLVAKAKEFGFVVMPYTNPTWWDTESVTLLKRPAGTLLRNLLVIDANQSELSECYGCPANPHYGYVMSPYAPFVQERLAKLMDQMKVELGADMVFEDQIGARAPVYDYNPASPGPDRYIQGWVEHTRQYANANLATELGFDRLVQNEVGFHGSALLPDRTGGTKTWWGSGTWHYYPFVTMAARDKALFYQHDLAPETFAHNKANFSWDLAFGYMLSYDLFGSNSGGGARDDMIRVVSAFQKQVLARYANERVLSYRMIAKDASLTDFTHFTVVVNWNQNHPYEVDGSLVTGGGVMVRAKDGSLTAGIFRSYAGQELEPGDHYLIEERGASSIRVFQPMGSDTPLTVRLLPGWSSSTILKAEAFGAQGQVLGSAPVTVTSGGVSFQYTQEIGKERVSYYRIAP